MNSIVQININELHPFEDYPFRVQRDEELEMLAESISMGGVFSPLLVRPLNTGGYEIISGHRRHEACKMAGIKTVPAIVRPMERDDAVIAMVDCNLQRESLLPSEKAFAYRMKLDAISRQGYRSDLTSTQVGQKLTSIQKIANASSDSRSQIQRYIRLCYLEKPLRDLVDEGRIALTPAVELSYLSTDEQTELLYTIESEDATPSLSQAQRMREYSRLGILSMDRIFAIMTEVKGNQTEYLKLRVDELSQYFRSDVTPRQMEETIIKALKYYQKYLERQRNDAR